MKSEAEILGKTGERTTLELHKGALNYAKYIVHHLVTPVLVKNITVLYITSISGNRAELLAKNAKRAFGVDINKVPVEYIQEQYNGIRLNLKEAKDSTFLRLVSQTKLELLFMIKSQKQQNSSWWGVTIRTLLSHRQTL